MLNIIHKINILAKKIHRPIVLMELCGTHTEAVARHGIKKLLPKNIKLLSGPGCPVCVTDQRDINAIIALAMEGIPIACYGDVLRVPGTLVNQKSKIKNQKCNSKLKNNPICHCEKPSRATKQSQGSIINLSLDKTRELGADITEVYSVEDALELQKKKPNIVFFGLGFETTTPMTASAIKRGLTVYSSHKAFVPAMKALLNTPQLKIDGFINPGHVSAIIGIEPYKKFKLPQVIAGFEANDVLITIYMLLKQIAEGRAEVENEYTRLVRPEGNPKARKLINEVFETGDGYWRGIGKIPNSGFDIRPKYSQFDAKIKYKNILNGCHSERSRSEVKNPVENSKNIFIPRDSSVARLPQNDINSNCICGAILRGLKEPQDCKLFNKKCTLDNPVGACMVSSEGACGIEAKFKK